MKTVNCTALRSMAGFDEYMDLLRTETRFQQPHLQSCRGEVCVAIWGGSQPEIAGIGVSIGYIIEIGLGATLVLLSVFLGRGRGPRRTAWSRIIHAGLRTYFDCAVYFAITVEMAIIVGLAKRDLTIPADGFGAPNNRAALALLSVCIVPLMQPLSSLLKEPERGEQGLQTREHRSIKESQRWAEQPPNDTRKRPGGDADSPRESLSLLLYCLLVVVIFYPFMSQGTRSYADTGPDKERREGFQRMVTDEEWAEVRSLCFGREIAGLTRSEAAMLETTQMLAPLVIYLFAVWQLTAAAARRLEVCAPPRRRLWRGPVVLGRVYEVIREVTTSRRAQAVLVMVPATLACILLYSTSRMRRVQAQMLERIGARSIGDGWGFGQVAGIIMFAPVLTEMCFAAWEGGRGEVVTSVGA